MAVRENRRLLAITSILVFLLCCVLYFTFSARNVYMYVSEDFVAPAAASGSRHGAGRRGAGAAKVPVSRSHRRTLSSSKVQKTKLNELSHSAVKMTDKHRRGSFEVEKRTVWEIQDRKWSVLSKVVNSILSGGDKQWTDNGYLSLPNGNHDHEYKYLIKNMTSIQQMFVYPLLRKYVMQYSNWSLTTLPGGRGSHTVSPNNGRKRLCLGNFCLNPNDKKLHFLCLKKSIEYAVKHELLTQRKTEEDILSGMQCNCRAMAETKPPRRRVALSSLPGSGNTWVRQLLEAATGICTGSMWCDGSLRANHFCGEGQHSESFLVIKDHSPSVSWRSNTRESNSKVNSERMPKYDAMILVHRDPFDATVAEWNRALFEKQWNISHARDMHVASYGAEMFGENLEWEAMIRQQAKRWKNMITNHVIYRRQTHPLLVVRYEDLKQNSLREVQRMLDFLQLTVDKDELLQRLEYNNFSHFHRNHSSSDTFEPYTASQIKYWNSVIIETETSLHSNSITDFIPLRSYIRKL